MTVGSDTGTPIALVGCVKSKRAGEHAAKDLYDSPLFKGRRRYVEERGMRWWILSAEHGLVAPDARLAPYDRTLNAMSASARRAWGRDVVRQLRQELGELRGLPFEIHAGSRYVDAIQADLESAGANVSTPTAGLGLGRQLAFDRDATPGHTEIA